MKFLGTAALVFSATLHPLNQGPVVHTCTQRTHTHTHSMYEHTHAVSLLVSQAALEEQT